jgi:hypothetical protein
MTLPQSPEFSIVAACSAWPPSNRRTKSIQRAAAGRLDWDRLLRVVKHHRVAGLVHDGLARAQHAVPSSVAREISEQATAIIRQNLALAAEALRLQRMFAEANLFVIFMKGTPLSLVAYGSLGLRHSKDIDLLVLPESMPAATTLLQQAGYRRFEPPAGFNDDQLRMWLLRCKEIDYIHDDRRIVVELHFRPFDNPRLMAELPVTGSTHVVRIDHKGELRTFGEDDLFAYLCVHGAIHSWFRLKWLADVGALLEQQPEGGVERLYRAAAARGTGRAAAQALLLCQRLLGTPLPAQLITTLRKRVTVRLLEAIALRTITADVEPTELRFGAVWSSLARFLIGQGWRYRLAELKVYSTSPVDILTLPLPERLQVLYPVLRLPLWLWRHGVSICPRGQPPP